MPNLYFTGDAIKRSINAAAGAGDAAADQQAYTSKGNDSCYPFAFSLRRRQWA